MSLIRDGRVVAFLLFILSFGLFYLFTYLAKTGYKITPRTLTAIQTIPEAVGRCAEMGKPLLLTTGASIQTLSATGGVDVLAGISIIGYAARFAAQTGVKMKLFTTTIDAMPLIEETLRNAYIFAGKPDEYTTDIIDAQSIQSSLVSTYLGYCQRDLPASAIMMGSIAYEAVVMAEAGNKIGALQLSGTTNQYQTAFLVASTDYTLIMEELLAASALISGDLDSLGVLGGEDILKFIILAIMAIGMVLAVLGIKNLSSLMVM